MLKKLTAVLLSVLFAFGVFSMVAFATDDNSTSGSVSSADFLASLTDLINQYDFNSFDTSSGSPNETCRVIVKTVSEEALTDYQGAVATIEGWNSVHILQYTNSTDAETALEFYKAQDYVEYAEMDMYFETSGGTSTNAITSSTKLESPLSWGTDAVNIDTLNEQITSKGMVKSSDEVVVAVFDTGLTSDHIHFDSDRILKGYNVFNSEADTSDGDRYGHGTHVTGIIYDNTISNVKIRPYRIDTSHGLNLYTALTVVGTAIYLAVDNGDDLINVSMAWGSFGSEYIDDAIDFAYKNNVPMIVAAGNDEVGDGYDANYVYPAYKDNVITVAAINDKFAPMLRSSGASYSTNYGSCVNISAPGQLILSTVLAKDTYDTMTGSSQAAPFVSAAVATIKLVYPDITCEGILTLLEKAAYVPEGWNTQKYGVGILDCTNLFSAGIASKPTFSVNDYGDLVISTTSESAEIYYTTDNTTPIVGESNLYTNPIDTSGISVVKAVAYEEGKVISNMATYTLVWNIYVDVDYKHTENLDLPTNLKVISCYSSDKDVVTVDKSDMSVYGVSKGDAKVTVFFENNRKAVYHITVDYNPLQWFIIIVLWGFLWYI